VEKEVLLRMNYLDHLHEETLEAYLMGNLSEQDVNSLEDHLLLCEHCQLRTREAELDWKAKRIALQRIRDREGSRLSAVRRFWDTLFGSTAAKAGWAVAGATVAIAAIMLLPSAKESDFTYRTVELSAMRGSEELSVPINPKERLRLHLDLTELEKLSVYHVAIVDASGDLVWEQDQKTQGEESLNVNVPKRLAPGTYWVRLLDTAPNRRLLREYALPLR
jgi:hypothetical protein